MFRAKVLSKLRVATGSGETTGSKYHTLELECINIPAARNLLWGLNAQGPTKRGDKLCWNWEVQPNEVWKLHKLLSRRQHRPRLGSFGHLRQVHALHVASANSRQARLC